MNAALDRDELEIHAEDPVVENWIAERLMSSIVSVYLLSIDAYGSGWVHRESEWQSRVLGTKSDLVLPYLVVESETGSGHRYPPSRVIARDDLENRTDEMIDLLAARVTLDWLMVLRRKRGAGELGIIYRGAAEGVVIIEPPELTTIHVDTTDA